MVRIRLMRIGSRGRPFYRVVVADQKRARNSKTIEEIGWYNPLTEPSSISLKRDRVEYWLKHGAQPSESVAQLLKRDSAASAEK